MCSPISTVFVYYFYEISTLFLFFYLLHWRKVIFFYINFFMKCWIVFIYFFPFHSLLLGLILFRMIAPVLLANQGLCSLSDLSVTRTLCQSSTVTSISSNFFPYRPVKADRRPPELRSACGFFSLGNFSPHACSGRLFPLGVFSSLIVQNASRCLWLQLNALKIKVWHQYSWRKRDIQFRRKRWDSIHSCGPFI